MYKFLIYLSTILSLTISSFFITIPKRFSNKYFTMEYKFAKEYYDFYVKFKDSDNLLLST